MADDPVTGELGAYLRRRREVLTPEEVGLSNGTRRRTPGLRRSEVSTLAGISVEYLTRLEQGRDRHPSLDVLAALCAALRVPDEEFAHVQLLAKVAGTGQCTGAPAPVQHVRPTVLAVLHHLEPAPAFVVDRLSTVLAYTRGFERLARPVGLLDDEPANLARYVFTDPRARTTYPNWERVADEHSARLRTEATWDAVHSTPLVAELTQSGPAFSERWRTPPAPPVRTGFERWQHPEVGELRFTYETLELSVEDQRLVVLLPTDEQTAEALGRLAGRHRGALRVVEG